ncbi:hypothetical protein CRG98_007349 [Punica granatum]|uniref:Uncharacterized protein n=1 Tax=Punica granatum TaxID=22663 RepID=A0A2I0KUX7_PUNGR|nr:hypothetical protein CRG98_007349 [Punica granatum]
MGPTVSHDQPYPLPLTVWVDPTTLGTNDHHGHLDGSLGYPRPLTLPQNSIGSLRGDVRPDMCQSGLSTLPVGSVATIRVCSSRNSPNPTHQRSNPTFEGSKVSQRFRVREQIESTLPPNRPPKILARFQGIDTLESGALIPS